MRDKSLEGVEEAHHWFIVKGFSVPCTQCSGSSSHICKDDESLTPHLCSFERDDV